MDSLHEEMNRKKTSRYVALKDYVPGESEDKYFQQYYQNYSERNISHIDELFFGHFKSSTQCPDCPNISLKYEPFNILSLPVYEAQNTPLGFYFISEFSLYELVQITFNHSSNYTIDVCRKLFCKQKDLNPEEIGLYLYNNQTFEFTSLDASQTDCSVKDLKRDPNLEFIFMIHDRNVLLKGSQPQQVYFSIDGVDTAKVVGLRKPFTIPEEVSLANVYRFVYNCISESITDKGKFPRFEEAFGSDEYDPPFLLLWKQDSTEEKEYPLTNASDKRKVNIPKDALVKIRVTDERIKSHPKLRQYMVLPRESLRDPEGKVSSVKDCLKILTDPEFLDKSNLWNCDKCKGKKKAKIELKIKRLPQVLIIHFKRIKRSFNSATNKMVVQKMTDPISFPLEDFSLSEYMAPGGQTTGKVPSYSLFGMINHAGSPEFGHYIAIVKNSYNNTWYKCDDETISELPLEEVEKFAEGRSEPYLLFYRRI